LLQKNMERTGMHRNEAMPISGWGDILLKRLQSNRNWFPVAYWRHHWISIWGHQSNVLAIDNFSLFLSLPQLLMTNELLSIFKINFFYYTQKWIIYVFSFIWKDKILHIIKNPDLSACKKPTESYAIQKFWLQYRKAP